MTTTIKQACDLIKQNDYFVILPHAKPDGDTLGSAFALLYILWALGKRARVESPDGFPDRYRFLYADEPFQEFDPQCVIAVDVAGPKLLGDLQETYESRIDLCVDHHKSNDLYAKATLLDVEAAATAEVICLVGRELGVRPDKRIADAVFTGLTTDTGCFKYSNVTSRTHRIAGEMIDAGADHGMINKLMFQTKSRGRIGVDRMMMENLVFHFDGRCASILVPADVTQQYAVTEEELDGIAAFPCTIEGVLAGVTLRDRGDGGFRISLRTVDTVDASRICAAFGGGGHRNAAGCTVSGSGDEVLERLLREVERELLQNTI